MPSMSSAARWKTLSLRPWQRAVTALLPISARCWSPAGGDARKRVNNERAAPYRGDRAGEPGPDHAGSAGRNDGGEIVFRLQALSRPALAARRPADYRLG